MVPVFAIGRRQDETLLGIGCVGIAPGKCDRIDTADNAVVLAAPVGSDKGHLGTQGLYSAESAMMRMPLSPWTKERTSRLSDSGRSPPRSGAG